MRLRSMDQNSLALALLRITVGILFLIFAEYKVFGSEFTRGGGFEMWIHRFLNGQAAYPFMIPVLRDFVLPHAKVIALLTAYGELVLGLALAFGVLVRIASICGIAYMLALLFSSNYPGPHVALWQYFGASLNHLVLALCFGAFAIGNPERVLSLSSFLKRSRNEAAP
ncbi:MAG: DoxX family protein [Vulcanimicrobiaceae bacterium]